MVGCKRSHHDDPHPPYRFGLLPEPLTAPPSGGWKMNVPMASRPEAFLWTECAQPIPLRAGRWLLATDMRNFMPAREREPVRALSDAQIRQFIEDGFVRID